MPYSQAVALPGRRPASTRALASTTDPGGMPSALADTTVPALTTVTPPAGSMGRMAAQLLIASLDGQEPPEGPRLFAGDLVQRGSSGPAPSQ